MRQKLTIEDRSRRKAFGHWLQQQRLKAGLTQAELGKRLDLDSLIVGNYEQGRRLVSRPNLLPMIKELKVSKKQFCKEYLKADNFIVYEALFGRGLTSPSDSLSG